MSTPSIKQKIFLITFGVILTFFILEGGLRALGFFYNLNQEKSNKVALSEDEFRILCIGESTTALGGADSYPSQLEAILNERTLDRKVKIINKGQIAKTTTDVLAQLEKNLDKYKPDLVVTMLGINDRYGKERKDAFSVKVEAFLKSFRVYKFFELLKAHLSHRFKEKHATTKDSSPSVEEELDSIHANGYISEDLDSQKVLQLLLAQIAKIEHMQRDVQKGIAKVKDPNEHQELEKKMNFYQLRKAWLVFRLGRHYRERGEHTIAQEYLQRALAIDPDNFGSYIELGRSYKDQKQYDKAAVLFLKALESNPDTYIALMELGRCYSIMGYPQKTYELFQRAFEKEPKDVWVYTEIGEWMVRHKHFKFAETVYLKAIEKNPTYGGVYQDLSKVYTVLGEEQKASLYLKKGNARANFIKHYLPITVSNYNKIVEAVHRKGIPLICMQYPLREIEPLEEVLWSKDKIIFVENRENFRQALQEGEYSEYFSDNFAGDFGHCRRKGNRLIAKNLADVIVNKILK